MLCHRLVAAESVSAIDHAPGTRAGVYCDAASVAEISRTDSGVSAESGAAAGNQASRTLKPEKEFIAWMETISPPLPTSICFQPDRW